MSQINKDTIITQCANGYRMVTGTSNPIKYGELGTLISTLSNGVTIGDITYNNDGTITVTEDDGTTTHTLATTYTNGVLTALTYDGNSIALTYDANGNLTVLGDTPIDVSGYAGQEILDNTVKFVVEDNTYQIVSVNAGAAVAAVTEPSVPGFGGWLNANGEQITFPYIPVGNETITAAILEKSGIVANHAEDLLFVVNGISSTKVNTGFALCGYAYSKYNGGYDSQTLVLVYSPISNEHASFMMSNGANTYNGTVEVTRQGITKTWFYCFAYIKGSYYNDSSGLRRHLYSVEGQDESSVQTGLAQELADMYYGT